MSLRSVLPLALVALVGCGRASQDASKVLANVGGHKISEADLAAMVHILVADSAQADALLKDPKHKGDRQALVAQLAQMRQVLEFGQAEGFENEPQFKMKMDLARARAYQEMWAQRAMAKVQPTEAQLQALYAKFEAQMKAAGQAMPPYDQALPRLTEIWQQEQQERLKEALQKEFQKEVEQKVPMTLAE